MYVRTRETLGQAAVAARPAAADDLLTPNFRLREFYSRRVRGGPKEIPVPAGLLGNVRRLAQNLQVLRDHLGRAITVTSGYRTPAYNRLVGGAERSQHMRATAADITVRGRTPTEVSCAIEALINQRRMEEGGLGIYRSHVHYDVRGHRARWRVGVPESAPGATTWVCSAEQRAFLERVLQAHISRSGRALPDLRDDELARVAGTNIQMRADAAVAAGRLLAAANRDLAAARNSGDEDALRTVRISATSGYRGRAHQERIWWQNFPRYYNETAARRAALAGGQHGDAAIADMVTYVGGRVAAPGFSKHQAGVAIDFWQNRTPGNEIRNDTDATWVRRWRDTWFFRWLERNAARFGFRPYEREPWHWEYR